MDSTLATTGTNALLEQLSPFVPDEFINELVPPHKGRGRRRHWSPSQLYRLLLLTLLTPAHSCNLMLQLLAEQRSWRRFARLPNLARLPVASQLHEFRQAIGVRGLRRVNEHLLTGLLEGLKPDRICVGLMDATDLPAATSAFKKRSPANIQHGGPLWVAALLRPDRVGGMSATRSTRCDCGSTNGPSTCCLFRSFLGLFRLIAANPCSFGPVSITASND